MGKYTPEELWDMEDLTDWERVDREEPAPDEDSPEATDEEWAQARPAREVLREQFGEDAAEELLKPRKRGRQKGPLKIAITIRLSPEVVNHFRDSGPGWQTRINEVLLEWVAKQ